MPTRCNRGFYCKSYCLQAIRSAIKTSVASSWHFISTKHDVFDDKYFIILVLNSGYIIIIIHSQFQISCIYLQAQDSAIHSFIQYSV